MYHNKNYIQNVVIYTAGFVMRSILKCIQYEPCASKMQSKEKTNFS